jgi:hypothetical protein
MAAPLADCPQRPAVPVQTSQGTDGRLLTTIGVTTNSTQTTNRIVELRFGQPRASTNAIVDITNGPQGVGDGARWVPPGTITSATLAVRQVKPAQAATVNLTVVDLCATGRPSLAVGPGVFPQPTSPLWQPWSSPTRAPWQRTS